MMGKPLKQHYGTQILCRHSHGLMYVCCRLFWMEYTPREYRQVSLCWKWLFIQLNIKIRKYKIINMGTTTGCGTSTEILHIYQRI